MKRVILLLSIVLGIASLTADLTYVYNLPLPSLKVQGDNYVVKLDGGQALGEPGAPNLPWIGSKLLLPSVEEAVAIQIKKMNPSTYQLDKPIIHLQPQYPLSQIDLPQPVTADQDIYGSAQAYPVQDNNGTNTQFLCGHPINFTAFCPFEYYPQEGLLKFYQTISVTVVTSFSSRASESLRLKKEDAFTYTRLTNSVDNTDRLPRYLERTEGFEYLIIYDAAKQTQWQPLKDFYNAKGYSVYMKPVQEIASQFTGIDLQEKIRNFIISFYTQNSLRYVLLAGDTDVIPHRGFYVNISQGEYVDADIPADMYYGSLDGTWNDDGDNYWGEYFEADLVPDVAVGRFCYNSDEEIASFINKTSKYQNEPVISEAKSVLFVGEWLWEGPTWGGDYMDEMIGGSSAHGYTTVGVDTDWNITTLYDRTYGYADAWTINQLRPLINNGPNLINHLGHSATTYCMRFNNNNVTNSSLTNNGINHNFSVIFTQGCYAGAFDNRETTPGYYTSDCITEKFTSINNGAAAMISHSRYGWGMQGSTDGPSQYFHRQYIDALFGEEINALGVALMDSKIDNIPYIQNSPVMYWVTYETNLFGDPAMSVWTDTPTQLSVQLPSYWTVGLNNYQVLTNAPLAKLRLKNGDTIIFEGQADTGGLINISLMEPLVPGNYDLYVNAANYIGYHSQITVQANEMPYIVASNVQFLDQDNLYHTGEVVNIDVTIENVGLINQSNPGTITLTSNSPNIEVLSGSYSFDPLAAAETSVISGFFSIRIIGNYNDHQVANIAFVASFDGYSATTPVNLVLNSPVLSIDSYQFINTNNLILPGDNPSLNLLVHNSGSGNAYNPMLLLFSDNPWVTLSAFEANLSPIEADNYMNYENVFNVLISSGAPLNTSVDIGYLLSAENGNVLEGNFTLYLGMLNYNFEPDMMGWSSFAPSPGFVNQWHRSDARNCTSNGNYSMKFGGEGTSNYSSSAYGALESPIFNLGKNSRLLFNHWMNAEIHNNPQYAWDGGTVQISVNNGEWTSIAPVGGYPQRIYNNNASPYPANTPVYSGSFNWTGAEFDLSNYSGTAKFRFLFGSDGYVTGEGWYIDDVRVESDPLGIDEPGVPTPCFTLQGNYPNPFNPETTIRFSLPGSAAAKLEIFNIKGQKVRTLLDSVMAAGQHSLVWNGLDDAKNPVGNGVYFYRLSSGGKSKTRKMIMLK